MPVRAAIADLFRLTGPLSPKRYAAWGFSLAFFKYATDVAAAYFITGEFWHPLQYLAPSIQSRFPGASGGAQPDAVWLPFALVIWSLPFVWIGLALTFRRVVDAGQSAWLSLLYFVPIVNYAFMILLCVLPTAPRAPIVAGSPAVRDGRFFVHALRGFAVATAIALGSTLLSVYLLGAYGGALFFGTPVLIGVVLGFVFNRPTERSLGATLGLVSISIVMSGAALLFFAIEGLLCILMAAPLALGGAILGGVVGRAIARISAVPPYRVAAVLLAVPSLSGIEARLRPPLARHEVVSSIEIDAPPEKVWPHVIGFSELPPPTETIFRSGIAYPVRARIEGSGVGAVRYCEFSTGPFVEPITRFEPPSRLSFDVREHPLPMRELSPYAIHPPHLDGYFRSVAGEFRLVRLEGARTRVEGSTWYELDLAPATYWNPLAAWLIHAIHLRVLAHIRALATS
jgi:uncharacterized membrane protein YhaH (DUF805 family)